MLTLEDCIDLCGLTRNEILYLVEKEHISELRAAELGEKYVVVDDAGVPHLLRSVIADIQTLKRRRRTRDAESLEAFVRDFVLSHPHLNTIRP